MTFLKTMHPTFASLAGVLLPLLACQPGGGEPTATGTTTTGGTTGNPSTTDTTGTSSTMTSAPTTGTDPSIGSTTEPLVPCDILEQICPEGYVCEGGFEEAFCVPDLCIGVTCEEEGHECYQGVCTCAFSECPDGMYCDVSEEPETCKPDPCADDQCPIFSWCYPSVGQCETCPESCGPGEVCDQPKEECAPIVETATDACADAPLIVVPPYPDDIWIAGDLGAATAEPLLADCTIPDEVEQIVRVQLNDDGTFFFSGKTESLGVSARLIPGACEQHPSCGTGGISSGSPILDDYEFSLGYFFDPGTYVLVVSGPPGSGPWWLRIGQQ